MSDQSDSPIISQPLRDDDFPDGRDNWGENPIIPEPAKSDDDTLLISIDAETLMQTENPWDNLWRRVTALEQASEQRQVSLTAKGRKSLEKESVIPTKVVQAYYREFLSLIDSMQKLHVTHGERIGQIKLLEERIRQAMTALPYESHDENELPF